MAPAPQITMRISPSLLRASASVSATAACQIASISSSARWYNAAHIAIAEELRVLPG